jgi:hypothetical protein
LQAAPGSLTYSSAARGEAIAATAAVGVVGTTWTACEFIGGAKTIAVAQADDDWQTDLPGITIQQFNKATRLGHLPNNGGWFSATSTAIAPAAGTNGAKMTTQSEATIGFTLSSQKVNFPVREGKPIYGWGAAQGSAVRAIQRAFPSGPAAVAALGPVSGVLFEGTGIYTISDVQLFAAPGQHDTAFADFTYGAWMTPTRSSRSLTDAEASNPPSDAFFTQVIAGITVVLNTPDDSSPFLSFEGTPGVLSAADFDPITLTADGLYTTHLNHPVTVPYTIRTMIPTGMDSFSLFQASVADAQLLAPVPEPATAWLLVSGLVTLAVPHFLKGKGEVKRCQESFRINNIA